MYMIWTNQSNKYKNKFKNQNVELLLSEQCSVSRDKYENKIDFPKYSCLLIGIYLKLSAIRKIELRRYQRNVIDYKYS